MAALLTRARVSPAKPRFSHPRLEALEDRTAPATLTLNVSYMAGKSLVLSGQLSDTPNPGFRSISISGKVTATTFTNVLGQYNAMVSATGLGDVSVTATDGSSNTVTATLTDQAPVLTSFDAVEGQTHCWTFRGTVTYHRHFNTMTINLGGVPVSIQGKTATADNTGHFEITLMLNGYSSDNGTVWAKAVSPWGLESNMLTDYVHQTGT
jgi:hypothetical protein